MVALDTSSDLAWRDYAAAALNIPWLSNGGAFDTDRPDKEAGRLKDLALRTDVSRVAVAPVALRITGSEKQFFERRQIGWAGVTIGGVQDLPAQFVELL
jgi:hypothetical protein